MRTKGDKRGAYLHRGSWALKLAAWALFTALPFLLPSGAVEAYAWAARAGAALFLVVQMLILVDFAAAWNEAWVARGEDDERFLYGLLALTVAGYAGALGLAGALFALFKPAAAPGGCALNVTLITLALLLCVGFSALSVLPVARGGSLFPSAVVSLYVMYLCYSALSSEPRAYACNGLGARLDAASGAALAAGMVLALLSVVYSALRAGSNTQLFTLADDDDDDEDDAMAGGASAAEPLLDAADVAGASAAAAPGGVAASRSTAKQPGAVGAAALSDYAPVPYSYSFFHLIFALASMYMAMLFTGWGAAAEIERGRVDVGWASVWVKAGAQWAVALLYAWTLVAPAVFPDRFS